MEIIQTHVLFEYIEVFFFFFFTLCLHNISQTISHSPLVTLVTAKKTKQG